MIGANLLGKFSEYHLAGFLGEGGFGQVFQALDTKNLKRVAIKLLLDCQNADALKRFRREREIMGALEHPHIMPLLDSGEDAAGNPWYAMPEMLEGSLDKLLGSMRSPGDHLCLISGIAAALAEIHSRGGFHRDVKLENIFIDDEGRPRLGDFGLARIRSDSKSRLTHSACGTQGYMAPEVWNNRACAKSDIYALGIVLWELGHNRRWNTPARPPEWQNQALPFPLLGDLYEEMTRDEPDQRPTAEDVFHRATKLYERLNGAQDAGKDHREERTSTKSGTDWLWQLVVVAFLALLAFVAYQAWKGAGASTKRRRARR